MKKLYIIRHAKSSWEASVNSDFDRPLNERGKTDATAMGQFLKSRSILPDQIFCSSAVRAETTAKSLAKEIGFDPGQILPDRRLYMADVNHVQSIMREFADDWNTVFLVGHNPTVTECVNLLANQEIENVPTCGVASISLNIDSWLKLRNGIGELDFFQTPKQL